MTAQSLDPYRVLGVAPDARADEIKAAYRQRSKEQHPDKGGDPAAFADLAAAWRVLSDPVRRAEFDKTGCMPELDQEFNWALQQIGGLASEVIATLIKRGEERLPFNLIEVLGKELAARIQRAEEELAAIAGRAALYQDIEDKLGELPEGTPDPIRGVLGQRRFDDQTERRQCEQRLRIFRRAQELLAGMSWKDTLQIARQARTDATGSIFRMGA